MEITKSDFKTAGIKFTAKDNGKIVGWALLYIIKNDRHDEPYGLMENVYVEKEYRKKGIGRQLVEAVIDEAKRRGCYKLIGTSRHMSTDVHKFYEKFSFRNHGIEFRMDLKESRAKQDD